MKLPLLAGYAEADITPQIGGSMPGGFEDRLATGTLDPLKAKALYLRMGATQVALLACDLLALGAFEVERIRRQVDELIQPALDHVWVHCLHTHTGGMIPRKDMFTSDTEQIYPGGIYAGVVNPTWVDHLVTATAKAVAGAAAAAGEEPRLTLHEGQANSIAYNRRFLMKDGSFRTNPGCRNPNIARPAGTVDTRVHVLRFERQRLLTVIFGLHACCVGGRQYSADWPYHLTEAVRRELGNDWRVVVFNAACGDINHVDVNDPRPQSGYKVAQRIGQTLAGAALAALRTEAPFVPDRLAGLNTRVPCRLRRPDPKVVQDAEALLTTPPGAVNHPIGLNELYAPAVKILAATQDREHIAEISVLQIGSLALAGLPGEYFIELARELETGSPFHPTRVLGLTNGSMGYIPTREAYGQGGYECGYRGARYDPENGHTWARTAAALLQKLALPSGS